ncbi:hypothetical protein H8D36_01080, partial [archaeon]|nr:hypothetical protein [archaeon]
DFEIQELCKHAKALQNKGANAMISLATLNQAKVSSKELQRITAKIRLALPNISIMVSGRERERDKLFPLIDYVGTGGVTFPGGRTVHKNSESLVKQFNLGDTRTPKEIISFLKSININVKE